MWFLFCFLSSTHCFSLYSLKPDLFTIPYWTWTKHVVACFIARNLHSRHFSSIHMCVFLHNHVTLDKLKAELSPQKSYFSFHKTYRGTVMSDVLSFDYSAVAFLFTSSFLWLRYTFQTKSNEDNNKALIKILGLKWVRIVVEALKLHIIRCGLFQGCYRQCGLYGRIEKDYTETRQ